MNYLHLKTAEFNYTLHNHIQEVTKDSKYLGVTFSSDLSRTSHINNISAKANRTIGFLRRNIHSCPKEVKAAAYTTLVRPSIEYASTVWDPYTRNNILMNMRNNSSPSTVSWGTPESTSQVEECVPSSSTC
jgi:hypothetical protein